MIQVILVIYLIVSINGIAKEKNKSSIPYICATICLSVLPFYVERLCTGAIQPQASVMVSVTSIGVSFIPRAVLRGLR